VKLDDLPLGGILTVFPDGDATDPNSATLMIRVDPGAAPARPGPPRLRRRAASSPIRRSATHAGCPVGLYRSAQAHADLPRVTRASSTCSSGRSRSTAPQGAAAATAADPDGPPTERSWRWATSPTGRPELLEHYHDE
jgi:hypothetical protein